MPAELSWEREGRNWPNHKASRFVEAGGIRWHVQVMGQGPVMLALHGTGSSTHSFAKLAPKLAKSFTVVVPDLPGHGFTELPRSGQCTLQDMARSIAKLLTTLNLAPVVIVGHSAGAAIAVRMALDRLAKPRTIISLCGALLPFPGLGAFVFPAMAKLLFLNPLAAPLIVRMSSSPGAVERLLRGTGSRIDQEGIAHYETLLRSTTHVAATIGMMAKWDLDTLARDLPRLKTKLVLVAAENDRAVPADVAAHVAAMVSGASVLTVPGLGHLAHEEAPDTLADIISSAAAG